MGAEVIELVNYLPFLHQAVIGPSPKRGFHHVREAVGKVNVDFCNAGSQSAEGSDLRESWTTTGEQT